MLKSVRPATPSSRASRSSSTRLAASSASKRDTTSKKKTDPVDAREPVAPIGGQAVIEGVMMRGRNFVTCAVRGENGAIVVKSDTIPKNIYAGIWSKTPFLRALPLLWDTLVLGTRMLMWAANEQMKDEAEKERKSEGERLSPVTGSDGEGGSRGEESEEGCQRKRERVF